MPTPIPEPLSSILRSDSTAALGALMVIASAHRDLFNWAARMVGAEPTAKIEPKPNGKTKQRKRNGAGRPARTKHGAEAYHQRQRKARDESDSALLDVVRDSPEGSISDWMSAVGRSRSSTLSALKRLRDAGLAESIEGKWRLTEEPAAPKETPRWARPVHGTDRAAQHHVT